MSLYNTLWNICIQKIAILKEQASEAYTVMQEIAFLKSLWFIINYNAYFRLKPFFWHSYLTRYCIATYLRRGGIFKHDFVAKLLPSPPVKMYENWLIFGEVIGKSLVSCFLTHIVDWAEGVMFSCCLSVCSCTPWGGIVRSTGLLLTSG